ncbi:hypothetical protein [Klebsiella grimontii]|uniref:hypothetical protein n=1 Tax=Klebsiella grimontii TaxID=2058152 RepID=UPI0012B7EFF6|nr:hypothetical protein [Klebsiella grimontii]
MNEQANKILIDLLQKAANGVDAAVSFSQAQVPDIIRQLMVWKAAAYGMRIFFMSLFLLGCILLFRRALKWHESFDYEALGFFSLLSSALTGALLVVGILANISNLVQLWLAPKIWLIEYTAELLKG